MCHIILAYPASECFENIPRIRFSWSYQFTKFLHLFMTHSVPNNLWNFLGIVLVFMTSLSTPVARSTEHPGAFEKGPQFLTLRNRHPGHSVVLLIYTATVSDTLWFYTHLPLNGLLSAWRTPVSITSVLSFCISSSMIYTLHLPINHTIVNCPSISLPLRDHEPSGQSYSSCIPSESAQQYLTRQKYEAKLLNGWTGSSTGMPQVCVPVY